MPESLCHVWVPVPTKTKNASATIWQTLISPPTSTQNGRESLVSNGLEFESSSVRLLHRTVLATTLAKAVPFAPVILLDCSAGIGVRMDKTYWCSLGVRRTLGFLLLALAAGLPAGLSSAAHAPQGVPMARQVPVPRDAAGHPDISGYWELRYDSRSVPPANLTQDAIAREPAQRQHDVLAMRFCALVGMPEVMEDGATLDIRQGPKVIGMLAKSPSSVRYKIGRAHVRTPVTRPSRMPSSA